MSDSKTAKPLPRFRLGFLSIVQVLLAVMVFLSVNYLSSKYYRPFDLSDDLTFTLAPSTQRYLQSDTVRGREAPIRMIVAFRADSPFYPRIRPIAEEYNRLADGKIELQILDPIRANDRAESIAAEYNLVFNQDLVIIDARSGAERAKPGAGEVSPHVNICRLEDMLVHETDQNNERRIRGFLGEDALRSALVNAIEGKPRRMWILADKSDLDPDNQTNVWPALSANLVSQNVLPERVQLAGLESIPEDVEAVAIIGARYDMTAEELAVLEAYWARPAASILVTTGNHPVPPRLKAFLRNQGVTPRNDQVLTVSHGSLRTRVIANFTTGMEITRDLWEKSTQFDGATRSLEVREGAEDLLEQSLAPFSLIEADPSYWGESDYPADHASYNADYDTAAPLHLAAAVIRGNANDDRFANQAGRMIVVSNTAFMIADRARQANLDFLASSVNWLVGRETLMGEAPENLRIYRLPLLPAQATFVNRVNLLILPTFFLLIGAMVWASRRS